MKEDLSLKKDVLQLQKKVVDLELATTELKEALRKFDASVLEDLKQRIEDVEDLTMIENAAIVELKKLLETTTKFEQPQQIVSLELEERLNSLEQKIASLSSSADISKFDEKISEIKNSFDLLQVDLTNRIKDLEEKVSEAKFLPDPNTFKTELKNEILATIPDYNLIRYDIQNVINNFKSNFEKEKAKLESILEVIQGKLNLPLPESIVNELEKIRNEFTINNARVEAVQKFVENFSNELNNLRPILAKIETFDRLINLHEEVSNKLRSFQEFQENIQKAVEKNENVERRIQHEINKLKETEKQLGNIEKTLSYLTKEIDTSKKELKLLPSLVNKFDSLEEKIANVENDMAVFQGNLMTLEQGRVDITAAIANLQESKVDTDKNFKALKTEIESLKQLKQELMNLKTELVNTSKEASIDLNEVSKKMESIEADLKSIKSLKSEDRTNELVNKIKELEMKINSFTLFTYDEQITDVLDRLVFLESRVIALESMIQDIPKYLPIVVE